MRKILECIEGLKADSFEGWSEDEKKGYLTALTTVERFVRFTMNHPPPAQSSSEGKADSYPLELLKSKLGEWQAISMHWDQQQYGPYGPQKELADMQNTADERIQELKQAIKTLESSS